MAGRGPEAIMAVRKNESMGFVDAALDGLGGTRPPTSTTSRSRSAPSCPAAVRTTRRAITRCRVTDLVTE